MSRLKTPEKHFGCGTDFFLPKTTESFNFVHAFLSKTISVRNWLSSSSVDFHYSFFTRNARDMIWVEKLLRQRNARWNHSISPFPAELITSSYASVFSFHTMEWYRLPSYVIVFGVIVYEPLYWWYVISSTYPYIYYTLFYMYAYSSLELCCKFFRLFFFFIKRCKPIQARNSLHSLFVISVPCRWRIHIWFM